NIANPCAGSFLLSSDNFATCVQMTGPPIVSNANQTYTFAPASPLSGSATYKIRLTTAVQDAAGVALGTAFSQPNGFTTRPALNVSVTFPSDAATGVAQNSGISVTFNIAANASLITTNTASTVCSGSLQVSADNFATCVQLTGPPVASGGNTVFSVTP